MGDGVCGGAADSACSASAVPHGPPGMAQPSTRPPNRCPTSPSSPQMNSNHPTRSPAARPRYRLPNLHPSTGWAAPRHLLFSFLSSFPSLAFPKISMPRTHSVGWGAGAVLGWDTYSNSARGTMESSGGRYEMDRRRGHSLDPREEDHSSGRSVSGDLSAEREMRTGRRCWSVLAKKKNVGGRVT